MPYLKWSENAIWGVQKTYRFLAERDRETAMAAAWATKKHAAVLARSPEAGRSTDDLDPEHRELIFPFDVTGCVLIYEVGYDSILILAVKHPKEVGY